MTKKEYDYNFYTNEELKQKIKNLHLIQRGEQNLDSDFSETYLGHRYKTKDGDNTESFSLNSNLFKNLELCGANFKNSEITSDIDFSGSNLTGADFRGCIFECKFNDFTNLEGADFRGKDTKYDIQKFSDNQKKQIIFTDEDYEKYQKKLEKENQELKKVNKNTSENETEKLLKGFKVIKKEFLIEEKKWLYISMILIISIIALSIIVIFGQIFPEKTHIYLGALTGSLIIVLVFLVSCSMIKMDGEEVLSKTIEYNKNNLIKIICIICMTLGAFYISVKLFSNLNNTIIKEPIFGEYSNYSFLPLILALFSFLYFAVSQYSIAKELRIENQNKIALLHGFQAINSNELITNKEIFHQHIADVVFTKAYKEKNTQNLPIDKVIDLIKLSK